MSGTTAVTVANSTGSLRIVLCKRYTGGYHVSLLRFFRRIDKIGTQTLSDFRSLLVEFLPILDESHLSFE